MGEVGAKVISSGVNDLKQFITYANAVCGSSQIGEDLCRRAVRRLTSNLTPIKPATSRLLTLLRLFQIEFDAADAPQGNSAKTGNDLRTRLHTLPVSQRQSVLLSHMLDLSDDDGAFVMGITGREFAAHLAAGEKWLDPEHSFRVLIVEDDPWISNDLKYIVSSLGHQVVGEARTHSEAVVMANKYCPNLLVCDVRLKDRSSGIEAAIDIRAKNDMPVVFVTAHLDDVRKLPLFSRPPSVSKPYSVLDVENAIARALTL